MRARVKVLLPGVQHKEGVVVAFDQGRLSVELPGRFWLPPQQLPDVPPGAAVVGCKFKRDEQALRLRLEWAGSGDGVLRTYSSDA